MRERGREGEREGGGREGGRSERGMREGGGEKREGRERVYTRKAIFSTNPQNIVEY